MRKTPIIIAYDISSAKQRYLVHKILKQWGLFTQKSVCECLLSKHESSELFLQLVRHLNHKTDRLIFARVEMHRPLIVKGNISSTMIGKSIWTID